MAKERVRNRKGELQLLIPVSHESMLRLGHRQAEIAIDYRDGKSLRPLLVAEATVDVKVANRLIRSGYLERKQNMLGMSVHLTEKGHEYLYGMRKELLTYRQYQKSMEALYVQVMQLHADLDSYRNRARSGEPYLRELIQTTSQELLLIGYKADELRIARDISHLRKGDSDGE